MPGDATILIAAVHEPPRPGGGHGETFAVLTTGARKELAHIHDRQPVIIPPADARDWLAADTPSAELQRIASENGGPELAAHALTEDIDDPSTIDPTPRTPRRGTA